MKLTTNLRLLAALALAVGLFPGLTGTAYADSVDYMEASYNEETGEVTYTSKTAEATIIESTTTTWSDGDWYVVTGNVSINNLITVTGTVHLILADGATLTASMGINVNSGNTLNIYPQSGETGTLIATGSLQQAGIGGGYEKAGGTVTIHGGNVTATNTHTGAGIGGGQSGNGGIVTIYGGNVTATNTSSSESGVGAGIGSGQGSSNNGGTVIIYGGIVTATGGPGAAGIGGGSEGAGGSVTINGGTVIASGGSGAHGIGGSKTSSEKTGTLTVGSGLKVFGGDSANPTTVITEYSSTRKQYMIVVGSVSYVELSFNSTTGQVTSAEKTVQP